MCGVPVIVENVAAFRSDSDRDRWKSNFLNISVCRALFFFFNCLPQWWRNVAGHHWEISICVSTCMDVISSCSRGNCWPWMATALSPVARISMSSSLMNILYRLFLMSSVRQLWALYSLGNKDLRVRGEATFRTGWPWYLPQNKVYCLTKILCTITCDTLVLQHATISLKSVT